MSTLTLLMCERKQMHTCQPSRDFALCPGVQGFTQFDQGFLIQAHLVLTFFRFIILNRILPIWCKCTAISRMSPSHLLWQGSHKNDEAIKVMGSIGLIYDFVSVLNYLVRLGDPWTYHK